MISVIRSLAKRHVAYALSVFAAAGLLSLYGLSLAAPVSAQSANSIYVTPASGNYAVGSSFTILVRENSGTAVNAVQADLSYSNNLQFVSIDASGSAFGIDAQSTGGGSSVSMARGTITPVTGDQLVARVTFKVVAAGAGTISVRDTSVALSSSTNTNVVNTRNGASYTLKGAGASTPAPSPAPSASPTPGASGAPTTDKTSRSNGNLPTTTIAQQGSTQVVPLPGDTTVELTVPATIVTTPDPGRAVTKVEYLMNGKVVATDVTPPYTHSVDTTKYRNGTYTLTTKTYYADGKVDVSNASLVIKNKFSLYQFWLQLRHYAWIVVIFLVIVAELMYLKMFRGRRQGPRNGPAPGRGMPGGPVRPGMPGAVPPANNAMMTSRTPSMIGSMNAAPQQPTVAPTVAPSPAQSVAPAQNQPMPQAPVQNNPNLIRPQQ